MNFPTVSGTNLLRQKVTLPQDLEGNFNLLFIPFQQWQQEEVNSWMPLVSELEAQHPDLVYYELPTIRSLNSLSKWFINEGMRAGIPNPKTRERTITLYLDKADFRVALNMNDEDHIYVVMVDRSGAELFRTRVAHSHESEAFLRLALGQLDHQEG
ncbi:MAG TPA: hypothetical protein VLR89_06180 [Anaerolineaceae bacterium]|nr:hypothetical protein [Anaerolineaceae bacterium]